MIRGLTLSAGLFAAGGLLWIAIGILTPLLLGRGDQGIVFFSARTDEVLFGAPAASLREAQPSLWPLRRLLLVAIAGLLVAGGLLVCAVAWFGVRSGERWALAALSVATLALLPFWVVIVRTYGLAGASPGIADIPPFMWVPAALWLSASVLGWWSAR